MTQPLPSPTLSTPRWNPQMTGSTLMMVGSVFYLMTEAITAAAWKSPPYHYTFNYVSDLGVTTCGTKIGTHVICSPLAGVMNTGFIVEGLLFAVAAFLFAPLLPRMSGGIYRVLAVLHAIGISLVALIHGSSAAIADGTIIYHALGAALAIFGGNLANLTLGSVLLRHRRIGLGWFIVALSVLGFVCGILTVRGIIFLDDAVVERMAVYTIVISTFVMGLVSLRGLRSARPNPFTGGSTSAEALATQNRI